jgi:hypothetical protein
MSDAARLARQSFLSKPQGQLYSHFAPSAGDIALISSKVNEAVSDSAYAAIVSYAEALSGVQRGSIAWSVVKLYYSCFYSIRALLLLNQVVPFNCKREFLLDIADKKILKGGPSSHHWNWNSIDKIPKVTGNWFASMDSQQSYEKLRGHRESVSYTHSFTDPNLHRCLMSGESDLAKRFRSYRDDGSFLYTYLPDHLSVAYPTKLIFYLDSCLRNASISLEAERIAYLKKIWSMKDRCPFS